MTQGDVREVLDRADRRPDGSYRTAAGRLLSGKVIGSFKDQGTRPDDPNDIVPHEHRRELRALRVFGAWTNLTDMKAGNTLDTIVTDGGRAVVRHYLQDVGSTFGVGANGPHAWNEGWELLDDKGPSRRRLLTFGFARSRWQTADYENYSAVGRFEGDAFEPETWKPRAPTVAFYRVARRRRVLGRPPSDGLLRRSDPRVGQDRRVTATRRRSSTRRRSHQAT